MTTQKKIDFLIVGTQKSGTSALDVYLRKHPEIEMARYQKEVHFFDDEKYFKKNKVNYEVYHEYFTNDNSKIKGKSTPVYMYWSLAMKRIYEYNPQIKIIAVLRNPIERAFSHWNKEKYRKRETTDFSTAIRQESVRCQEALPLQHRIFSYTDRGFYSEQIKRIWRFFPRNQTLFIKYDDFKTDYKKVLKEISSFLDISEFKCSNIKVNLLSYTNVLSNSDYKYLSKLYFNEIQKLEAMLNWDCSKWQQRRSSYLLQWIKLCFFKLLKTCQILRIKRWVLKQLNL